MYVHTCICRYVWYVPRYLGRYNTKKDARQDNRNVDSLEGLGNNGRHARVTSCLLPTYMSTYQFLNNNTTQNTNNYRIAKSEVSLKAKSKSGNIPSNLDQSENRH